MPVLSIWKVTYDPAGTPLVLVDFGDELTDNPSWAKTNTVQSVSRLRSGQMSYYGRGNAQRAIAFDVRKIHATNADMALFCLTHAESFDCFARKSIKVEIQGSAHGVTYSNCVFGAVPSILPDTQGAEPATICSYLFNPNGVTQF